MRQPWPSPPPPLRLLVVSSVRLVREGLVSSLGRRKDISVCASIDFAGLPDAATLEPRPEVGIIDLAGETGLAAAKTLKTLLPTTRLVAFSVAETTEHVFACAAAGFSGYVTCDACLEELVQAVKDAHIGHLRCSPQMAAAMFRQLSQVAGPPAAAPRPQPLTARETQILRLLNQGWSNKEIARDLQISPATVKNHIHNLLGKLQVQRRTQAAALRRE